MKTTVFLLASMALTLAVPVEQKFYSSKFEKLVETTSDSLTSHTFQTRVDHFRPQDGRVSNFTYVANLEFYVPNGPIFVYIHDGGIYHTEFIRSGLVYDVAQSTGGALITADHRYSGTNIPVGNATFDDLSFLTVDQALADIAVLVSTVKADLGNNEGKVILWGSGYGATLATFARKKFPHLVDAVFASSAWFRSEVIDSNYYDALSMIIRLQGSNECGDLVNAAFEILEYLFEHRESEYLQERLRLCEPIDTDNEQEIALIVYRFIDTIAQYIQYNHYTGLQNFCRDMQAIPADPLNSLIRWIEYAYGGGSQECVNANYNTIVAGLNQTEWSSVRAAQTRPVVFLSCTQLGGLKVTSDFALDVFPSNLITEEYQYRFCEDVLGPQYNRSALAGAVEALNLNYGGQEQVITHVVFSSSGLDPLLHHAIADYDQYQSGVVFLQHYGAGADLRSIHGSDSIDLSFAKHAITNYLTRWATPTNIENPTPTPLTTTTPSETTESTGSPTASPSETTEVTGSPVITPFA